MVEKRCPNCGSTDLSRVYDGYACNDCQNSITKDEGLKGLTLRLTLIPDQVYPKTDQPPNSFYTLLLTPKVNKPGLTT